MGNKHGDFIWYELMTDDAAGAQDFYRAVLGWSFDGAGQDDTDYRLFSINGLTVGGLLPLTPRMAEGGARACWLGYIGVEDVDRMAAAIASAKGSVHTPPETIPGVGRIALVSDPQGATFYIMTPTPPPGGGYSQSFAATEPMIGHCAWNELATTDPAAALNFYHDLFGWEKDGELDMGPLGKYEFLRHDFLIGAVMPRLPQMPDPMWRHYFRVGDIDTAVATLTARGGQVAQEPGEIPGGEFAMTAIDPQGALFALVGPRT
jgi:predicted enzyme related to lactoylglutathione lyase